MIRLEKNDFWAKLMAGDETAKRRRKVYILMRDYISGMEYNRRMKAKGEPTRTNLLGIQNRLITEGDTSEKEIYHFITAINDMYHNIQPWFSEKTMFLRENHNFTIVCMWYVFEQTTGEKSSMYGMHELTYNYIASGEHCSSRAGKQFFDSVKKLFELIK